MKKLFLRLSCAALGLFGLALPASAQPQPPPVTAERIKKIESALPDKAPAKPARPRKVLVYTLAKGYVHDSIPTGAKAIELMGKKTGAYETVISADPAMFEPDKLKDFDAIVMVSTTGELFGPPGKSKAPLDEQARNERLRTSLREFVARGKGLVGIHAAADSSYQWPEYGKMMGGYFNGHPWYKITMRIDDPTNPVNACFHGKEFTIEDEIYTFRAPYSRERLHVLTSIDLQNSKITKGKNRKDDDYAVSWLQNYGRGRVFYCSLGHRHETFWNPTVLQHYLAGIQFAIGDLKANASPSAKQGR
jgi:type 1 glutamine amidotransferase